MRRWPISEALILHRDFTSAEAAEEAEAVEAEAAAGRAARGLGGPLVTRHAASGTGRRVPSAQTARGALLRSTAGGTAACCTAPQPCWGTSRAEG